MQSSSSTSHAPFRFHSATIFEVLKHCRNVVPQIAGFAIDQARKEFFTIILLFVQSTHKLSNLRHPPPEAIRDRSARRPSQVASPRWYAIANLTIENIAVNSYSPANHNLDILSTAEVEISDWRFLSDEYSMRLFIFTCQRAFEWPCG